MFYLQDLLDWTFLGAPMDQYYVIIKCSQLCTVVTHCFTIMEANHGPCLHLVMSTLLYIANKAICLSKNYFHLLRDSFIFLDNIVYHGKKTFQKKTSEEQAEPPTRKTFNFEHDLLVVRLFEVFRARWYLH
ncbi:uncharacterized protein [Apostichopus japonicus]|uniref:uncharacterized protein n=1 Tax=Stichopus japonicus TaxID=307972 RepID=UPI003AB4212B